MVVLGSFLCCCRLPRRPLLSTTRQYLISSVRESGLFSSFPPGSQSSSSSSSAIINSNINININTNIENDTDSKKEYASKSGSDTDTDLLHVRFINKSLFEEIMKFGPRIGWYLRRPRLVESILLNSSSKQKKTNDNNITNEYLQKEGIQFEKYVYQQHFGFHGSADADDGDSRNIVHHVDEHNHLLPMKAAEATNNLIRRFSNINSNDDDDDDEDGDDNDDAYKSTILLQPTFISGNFIARPDVIVCTSTRSINNDNTSIISRDEWEIVEIKSSTGKSYHKKIPDIAFSVYVARMAHPQLHITKATLIVVNSQYVFRDNNDNNNSTNRLYKKIDVTNLVNSYIDKNDQQFQQDLHYVDEITSNNNEEPPSIGNVDELTIECCKHELFYDLYYNNISSDIDNNDNDKDNNEKKNHRTLDYPIWTLPRLATKRFQDLIQNTYPDGVRVPTKETSTKKATHQQQLPSLEISDINIFKELKDDDSITKKRKNSKMKKEKEDLVLLTKIQLQYYNAVVQNKLVIEEPKKLKQYLESLIGEEKANFVDVNVNAIVDDNDNGCRQQVHYLDFETVGMLNPPYSGMKPFKSCVTQYSVHTYNAPTDRATSTSSHDVDVDVDVDNDVDNDNDNDNDNNNNNNNNNNMDYKSLSHAEYLLDPQLGDCREELVINLLKDLGYTYTSRNNSKEEQFTLLSSSSSKIVVYSSFEKVQLDKLSTLFPQYSYAINDIIQNRLFDLEKVIKECGISHPKFYGRTSIKVVHPALCGEQSQSKLQYNTNTNTDTARNGNGNNDDNEESFVYLDGLTASSVFAEMIANANSKRTNTTSLGEAGVGVDKDDAADEYEQEVIHKKRAALLAYCKLDTLALFEIHMALQKMV